MARWPLFHMVVFCLAGLPSARHRFRGNEEVEKSQVLSEDAHRHLRRDLAGYDLDAGVWRPLQSKIVGLAKLLPDFRHSFVDVLRQWEVVQIQFWKYMYVAPMHFDTLLFWRVSDVELLAETEPASLSLDRQVRSLVGPLEAGYGE